MGYIDLQHLVARLDKAERRLLTQRTDPTSEYARMLSALMQNPEITEDALKRKLGYDAKNRKYYDTRSYLYNLIVEQLTSIWDSKGELSATPNAVRQAQTLLRKGLPEACIEHIHKALPKAVEDENLVARIELLQLEYEASVLVSGFWGQEAKHQQLDDQITHCKLELNKILSLKSALRKVEQIIYHNATGMVADNAYKINLSEYDIPNLEDITTRTGRYLWQVLNALTALFHADARPALEFASEAWQLVRESTNLIENHPNEYLNLWRVLLVAEIIQGRQDVVRTKLATLENLNSSNQRLPYSQMQLLKLLQFNIGVQCQEDDYDSAQMLRDLDAVLANLIPNAIINRYIMGLSYNAALIEIMLGNSREALKRINKLAQISPQHLPPGSYTYILLLEMVLLLENDHLDILESKLRAAKRHLTKNNNLFDFEKNMLEFFFSYIAAPNKKLQMDCIEAFIQQYRQWRETKLYFPKYEFMDFVAWAEGKLERLRTHK